MTDGTHRTEDGPAERLRHDRDVERHLLWKGLLALLVVVLLVVIRQHFFL